MTRPMQALARTSPATSTGSVPWPAATTVKSVTVQMQKPMTAMRMARGAPRRAATFAASCEDRMNPMALAAKATENCVGVRPKVSR